MPRQCQSRIHDARPSTLTPEDHDERKPCRGCEFLQDQIRRDLEKDVWDEEDEECDVVALSFRTRHVEILGKALDFGIALKRLVYRCAQ